MTRPERQGRGVAWATLAVMALGLAAPLIERALTGFSPSEQHGLFLSAPAGARDVSLDHPSYDGEPAGFAWLDQDQDGRIDAAEVRAAGLAFRDLELLEARADADRDGAVTAAEADAAAAPLGHARALLGDGWHAALDADGDGGLTRAEIVAGTRPLRLRPAELARLDRDGDGALSRAEWPGAPRLRTFWAGTDAQGRDLLTRALHGLRLSVGVGLAAALIGTLLGTAYGASAGLAGGWIERLMLRGIDVLYALPFLFVIVILVVLLGPGVGNVLLAIALVQWLPVARVVRGEVTRLRHAEQTEAARGLGLPGWRLLLKHLVPGALVPTLPFATLLVPAAILDEAFLGFLGLGVQPPTPSLGILLVEGARGMGANAFSLALPAALLAWILFAFYRLGEAIARRIQTPGP